MIIMLVLVTALMSGKTVSAAQRDTFHINNKNMKTNIIPHNLYSNNDGGGSSSQSNINENTTSTDDSPVNIKSANATTLLTLMEMTTTPAIINNPATIVNTISSGSSRKDSRSVSSRANTINTNEVAVDDTRDGGPYFDKAASKNVTALLGKTAYLNCRVKNLGNKTMLMQVSWVRHRDVHLLTVGRYTYTSDQRFRAIHQPQTEDWILQIKYPQHRDSGIYECQVSTATHMSHYVHLTVVEPSTEIVGAPDLYIESGSTINLTCVIRNSPEPPAYIFWNHNSAIINYDSLRGGVSVVTNKGETTTSFLLIKSARPSDSGQYQCNPSNSKPKSVVVHVLNGKFPAAIQRAGVIHQRISPNYAILLHLSIYLFTLVYVKCYLRSMAVFG